MGKRLLILQMSDQLNDAAFRIFCLIPHLLQEAQGLRILQILLQVIRAVKIDQCELARFDPCQSR